MENLIKSTSKRGNYRCKWAALEHINLLQQGKHNKHNNIRSLSYLAGANRPWLPSASARHRTGHRRIFRRASGTPVSVTYVVQTPKMGTSPCSRDRFLRLLFSSSLAGAISDFSSAFLTGLSSGACLSATSDLNEFLLRKF